MSTAAPQTIASVGVPGTPSSVGPSPTLPRVRGPDWRVQAIRSGAQVARWGFAILAALSISCSFESCTFGGDTLMSVQGFEFDGWRGSVNGSPQEARADGVQPVLSYALGVDSGED